MHKQMVIFCDFDGTITEKDNVIDTMKKFAPPQWKEIVMEMFEERKTLKEGINELFALIPNEKKEKIVDFIVTKAVIREGFADFLSFCQQENIQFLVTSNGIDFFIEPILQPYREKINKIYCNSSDDSAPYIKILWPHPCDEHCQADCGMCKSSIIRSYNNDEYFKIVIGDSITDLEGAKHADFIIARSYLLDKCRELNLPHASFDTFHDCIQAIKKITS